jgi:hypothetical protein
MMMAGRLGDAGYRRTRGGALDTADDQCERDEKNNFGHSYFRVPSSFIRRISPFAGFHNQLRKAIVYARFQ